MNCCFRLFSSRTPSTRPSPFSQPTAVLSISARLALFLKEEVPADPLKKEYYLPTAASQAMEAGATVRVLKTDADWYGITYREDLDSVKKELAAMKAAGVYPDDLWA